MKEYEQEIYKMDPLPPVGTCLFHKQIKPSQESFLDMVRLTFFPYFALYSFTFFYLVLVTFVYAYSLSWHSEEEPRPLQNQFLKVSQKALFDLGENYPYYVVYKLHYYRLLTSMVLFRNFYHFMLSVLGILVFGSYIQQWVGFKRVFVLVVTSGAAGELLGNLLTDQAKLESSTPICGLIGYLMGVFVMHRKKEWKNYESEKSHMLLLLGISLGLFLFLSLEYTNISLYSQLAALFFGLVFYFTDEKHEQFGIKSLIIIIFLISVMTLLILAFFFRTEPRRVYR